MRVLILRDRKAGHVHRAEGLAKAIGLITDTEIERVAVNPHSLAPELFRQIAFRLFANAPGSMLRLLYSLPPLQNVPDVIVGSGRPTIAAGLWLSKSTGAKFIYSGLIRRYPLDERVLCVHGVPTPTTVEPERLPKPRPLREKADLRGATVSLLIGGNAYSHTFSDAEWRRLHAIVEEARQKLGIRWWVSTSRRTPVWVADLFASSYSAGSIERFVDFRTAGLGSAAALLEADAIVTTEDSRSMTAEAVAALRPVVALRCEKTSAPWVRRFPVDGPAERGVALRSIGGLSVDSLADTLVSTGLLRFDPREPLVQMIAPFLGLEPQLPPQRYGVKE